MILHLKQWLSCLKQYVLMCLFASGPDRLPISLHCILISLLAYCLIGFALIDEHYSYAMVVEQILLELGLLALIAYTGLKWKKSLSRFHQTFSALLGINLVISTVSIPVHQMLTLNIKAGVEINNTLLYATMVIVIWNLAVLSLIFKRALEINTLFSSMISFNYFLLYQFIIRIL